MIQNKYILTSHRPHGHHNNPFVVILKEFSKAGVIAAEFAAGVSTAGLAAGD